MAKQLKTKWAGTGRSREVVQWVADTHARRVPVFVIKTTRLRTKRAVVKRYGLGVAFAIKKDGGAKMIRKGVQL